MFFWVFCTLAEQLSEGSLSVQDTEIERSPYHKNCSCALHSKADICSNACQRNISFPKNQSWTDGSLCMQIFAASKCCSPLVDDMSIHGTLDVIVS
ncbi:hypothetical protein DVH24_029033 [Malus domestica]|uniref:Uncharacterized protein n=1 Tax=Malus domestica TaxID=3750 RepID=A0A498HWC9_MALDO|nr:hypothetical protein DVH24_029033 [Malus domestica]